MIKFIIIRSRISFNYDKELSGEIEFHNVRGHMDLPLCSNVYLLSENEFKVLHAIENTVDRYYKIRDRAVESIVGAVCNLLT